MKIIDVEGIGPKFRDKLHGAKVQTTDDLLEAGRTPAGRERLSDETGISTRMILEWVNHADLMRVKGVGSEYADLLEAAGVDTVVELAQRNAGNLAAAMADLNAQKKLVRNLPSLAAVERWVAEAKSLGRSVEY